MKEPSATPEAVIYARKFLSDVRFVPRNNGGVQLEWSTEDGFEMEVYFGPDGRIEGGFVAKTNDSLSEDHRQTLLRIAKHAAAQSDGEKRRELDEIIEILQRGRQ